MLGKLKSMLRSIVAYGYYYSGAHKKLHVGQVIFLMYHRVLPDNDNSASYIQPGMYVTESTFRAQIEFLNAQYQIISFADFMKLRSEDGFKKDKRYCVLTFDDGWLDNYKYAYPILKQHGVPATIFIPTSYIGTADYFWPEKLSYLLSRHLHDFKNVIADMLSSKSKNTDMLEKINVDDLSSFRDKPTLIDATINSVKVFPRERIIDLVDEFYKNMDVTFPESRATINWAEAEEMSNNGISFGSHTSSHTLLTTVSQNKVKQELESSMKTLVNRRVNYVPIFSYPNGFYTTTVIDAVKECGYKAAVTTSFGYERFDTDELYELKRIGVHNDISATIPLFVLHVSGLMRGKRVFARN